MLRMPWNCPQVNELTDELKMSLDKLHLAETELKKFSRSTSNSQLLPKTNTPSREYAAGTRNSKAPCTYFLCTASSRKERG